MLAINPASEAERREVMAADVYRKTAKLLC